MRPLHEYPLLRLLLAFIGGIIIPVNNSNHTGPQWIILYVFIKVILLVLIIHIFSLSSFRKNRTLTGVFFSLAFFLSGYYLTHFRLYQDFIKSGKIRNGKQTLIVRVKSPPSVRSRTFRMNAEVLGIFDGRKIINPGKPLIMMYIARQGESKRVAYGDILAIRGEVTPINGPKNPGQFDYRKYLERKHILKQVYVPKNAFSKLGSDTRPAIFKLALDSRDKLLNLLEKTGISQTGYAVSAAILLGYDDQIDPGLMRDYSDTGVIHVLCVSGMHVGILFVLLDFLIFVPDKRRPLKLLKTAIILVTIWFYSLITGFSPSVLRSAAMFTFILAGQSVGRKVDIRNSLLASAFFLLLLDPLMITDIGFQLSYAAVFSIVLYNRYVLNWLTPRSWLIRKLWELTAVSVSAQILVAPVVMFYFHKFSNYFIISNLVAIPLSTLILYNGMLVLVLSPVETLSVWVSKLMDILIMALNYSVSFINDLPFSSLNSLNMDTYGLLLVFALILSVTFFLLSRKTVSFILSLTCLCIILGLGLIQKYKSYRQKLLIFYSIRGHTAMSFVDGTTCYTLVDSVLQNDPLKYDYNIRSCITELNIRDHRIIPLEQNEFSKGSLSKYRDMACFRGTRLVIDKGTCECKNVPRRFKTDFLYISGQKPPDLKEIIRNYDFKTLLISPAMKKRTLQKISKDCKNAGIDVHPLGEDGSLVVLISGTKH